MQKTILILSDGRKGHINQSIALAKYLGYDYEIVNIRFKNKFLKLLSYLFDRAGLYTMSIFDIDDIPKENYTMVVSTGSATYYATKLIAKKLNAKSVAMMLPSGYKYDFDTIFAQSHDNPPSLANIIEIPANFSYIEPRNLYKATKKSIGIVIGGSNKILTMKPELLRNQLDFIVAHFKDYEIAITTSPRTSSDIEELVRSYHFDYEVIYSHNPINPIPDFLTQCETIFITADSTSMISEAISYGDSNVVILPLLSNKENKFTNFISKLQDDGYLHIFNGIIINKNRKIDFSYFVKKVGL